MDRFLLIPLFFLMAIRQNKSPFDGVGYPNLPTVDGVSLTEDERGQNKARCVMASDKKIHLQYLLENNAMC